jgi:type I restriction enzyme, S subunit
MNRGDFVTIEQPWPIPPHWRWSKMGDVAAIVGGGTPPTDRAEYFGGDVPWITPADLSKYTDKTISRGTRNITQAGLDNSGARILPAGTVLFSSRAPIGYVAIAATPVATNQGFKSFVLRDEVTPEFVYYYLQCARDLARSLASGTTFLEISGKKAAQIPIPVPPLDEQQRIVAEIEKEFTRLEAGMASLKRVQAALKRYRASVLKAACEGRLVPTEAELARKENRSHETGEHLLQRILKERRTKWNAKGKYKEQPKASISELPSLPEGWTWAPLEQLAAPEPNSITDGPFGSNLKTEHYTSSGPRVIRLQNIGDGIFVDEEAHISEKHFERLQKHRVFAGDLVIAALGENPPRSCVIPESIGPAIVKADCIRFKPHFDVVTKYANFALNSDPVRKRTKNIVHGVGRPRLNLSEIKSILMPVPPLAEQKRIVAEVERRLSAIETLQTEIVANLQRATRLRQSTLSKAFSGNSTI